MTALKKKDTTGLCFLEGMCIIKRLLREVKNKIYHCAYLQSSILLCLLLKMLKNGGGLGCCLAHCLFL